VKKSKQFGKELALRMFEWQIRFLPMPNNEQQKQVELYKKGLGLNEQEKKINKKSCN
jgi:hypothetical protein